MSHNENDYLESVARAESLLFHLQTADSAMLPVIKRDLMLLLPIIAQSATGEPHAVLDILVPISLAEQMAISDRVDIVKTSVPPGTTDCDPCIAAFMGNMASDIADRGGSLTGLLSWMLRHESDSLRYEAAVVLHRIARHDRGDKRSEFGIMVSALRNDPVESIRRVAEDIALY